MQETKITSFDNKQLHLYIWDNVKQPVGVLQLVHGSCEHAKRYEKFAEFLNSNGWVVIANDHRGHGKTADQTENELGYFADENGWEVLVKDLQVVNQYIQKHYEKLKIVMLGHSMGSFLARTFLIKHSDLLSGCVLSGTAWHPSIALKFGISVAKRNQKKHGAKYIDNFVWKQSYRPLNKKFKSKNATGVEWLSIDQENVSSFINDPLCGQIFTSSAFKDMFMGILYNQNPKNIKQTNKELKILLVAGNADPVGAYGKGVKKTFKAFKKQHLNCAMKLYPQLRHEILFDVKKDEVQNDTLSFLNSCLLNWEKIILH